MKVGFDAKRLFHNSTGLGNYSRDLVHGLAKYHPEHELHLFSPSPNKTNYKSFLESPYKVHGHRGISSRAWRSKGIIRDLVKEGIEIYHGLSHELPVGIKESGIKTVLTMHDLTIKTVPDTYKWVDRKIYEKKYQYAVDQADAIIAISESTKNDVLAYYEVDEARIHVIPPIINSSFYAALSEQELANKRAELKLPDKYFIYVGSIAERKNILTALEAILDIPESDRIPFILVGKGKGYFDELREFVMINKLQELVQFRTNVNSTEDLKAHIQGASAMVYPSLYEGFGIPCVEALFLGTPVITSDVSSLPEAAGPGAWLVNPLDYRHIADAMQKVMNGDSEVAEKIELGYQHAQQFKAEVLSSKLEGLYSSLISA